jgi:hypothetical protein
MHTRTQRKILKSAGCIVQQNIQHKFTPHFIQMKIGGKNFRSNKAANMAIKHTLNNENKYIFAK